MRVELTPTARNHLRNISRYTLNKWGKHQRNVYLRKIDQAFCRLAQFPDAGRATMQIAQVQVRSLPVEKHMIFYYTTQEIIIVIGVVHMSRDLDNYLHTYLTLE